jgi:hypothetical protein
MKKSTKVTATARRKAVRTSETPAPPASGKCVICGSEVAPFSEEKLCWVCRRLKVSAWAENTDTQMFAAE